MKRVGLAVLLLSLVPASARSSRHCEPREAGEVEAPVRQLVPLREVLPVTGLSGGYGLPVVEMPPPPLLVSDALYELRESEPPRRADTAALEVLPASNPAPILGTGRADCPVELRAVVTGEDGADSFVILGWSDTTALLHRGDRARTPAGALRVLRIDADSVVLERGGAPMTCRMSTSTR